MPSCKGGNFLVEKVLVHEANAFSYNDPSGINVRTILDSIAEAFQGMGYQVTRWQSQTSNYPLSVEFKYAVFWGGTQSWFPPVKMNCIDHRTEIFYAEVDDFGRYWEEKEGDDMSFILCRSLSPFAPNIGGVCGSRVMGTRFSHSGEIVSVRDGDLLVILQHEGNLKLHRDVCPIYRDSTEWLKDLVNCSALPIRVRKHPSYKILQSAWDIVEQYPNARWDDVDDLDESMGQACALACIDSHCGVRAIKAGIPVLTYGMAVYRHPGVSWRCVGWEDTVKHTNRLRRKKCDLDRGAMREFIGYLERNTWKLSDLPGRLERFLEGESFVP